VEYTIANEKGAVSVLLKEIKSYDNWPNILEEFSLHDLPPDFYRLRVRLLNERKEEIMVRESRFYLSAASHLPRPWVMSFPYPPANDPFFSNIIGNQFLKKNNLNQAKIYLEKAYSQEPAQVKYALDYAFFLLNGQEYARAKQIALPFLTTENRKNFLSLLGRACQGLGEYTEAIAYYQEYLNHFGTNLPILNSLGECYYRLGNEEEAMKIWKRSLEIDPNQKDLKKLIDSIKLKNEKRP
jgi:tetratricopeptide (TPR) repeat protein